jgi:hypothetical protein
MPNQNEIMDLIRQQQYEKMRKNFLARNMVYANPNWQKEMTKLSPEQEAAFLNWIKANKVPFDPKDKYPDYDMRGYYLSMQQGGAPQAAINEATQSLHYPDTFKTPYHESFSSESKWATEGAPSWQENKLVSPKGEVIFEDKPE